MSPHFAQTPDDHLYYICSLNSLFSEDVYYVCSEDVVKMFTMYICLLYK